MKVLPILFHSDESCWIGGSLVPIATGTYTLLPPSAPNDA
jgi:hypothetical protein